MGKRCKAAQSDCGRDYSQGIDLCLNDGKVATVSQQLLKKVVLMEKNNLKKKKQVWIRRVQN